MEPSKTTLNICYNIWTKIKRIEERERIVHTRKLLDNEVVTTVEKLGYYVQFEGSWESLYFGREPPTGWQVGDEIKITFQKVNPCPASNNTNPTTTSNSSSSATPSPEKPDR